MIICEDSDQLINLIASQEGVDVRDETEEGTNAIDIDSLPHLPELSAPAAPQPGRPQFQGPPPQGAPVQQFPGQPGQQPPPRGFGPQRPRVPQRPPPQRPSNPFGGLFGNFKLPFF